MTDDELRALHEYSSYHRDDFSRSELVGCFHCKAIFPAAKVREWIDDGQTALCRFCRIDSVLPDALVPITPELLAEMHRFWFDRPVD